MLVYVKVPIIEMEHQGGSKNKYKSLHNKIDIIHNSKKYNRTVYVKDNEKYILFKKEYILLSKLKYSKKLNSYRFIIKK